MNFYAIGIIIIVGMILLAIYIPLIDAISTNKMYERIEEGQEQATDKNIEG